MSCRFAGAFLVFVAAACGSDADTCLRSTSIPIDGALTTPDMLSDAGALGCVSGALGGRDPRGQWFLELENGQPFGGSGPLSVRGECGQPGEVIVGRIGRATPYETSIWSDTRWFWRARATNGDFEFERAYLVCENSAGELVGATELCTTSPEGTTCRQESLQMRPFGRIDGEPDSEGLELISQFNGSGEGWEPNFAANVRVKDDIAYFVHGRGGLRIIDVSDLETPVELATYPAESDYFNDVKIADAPDGTRYALVASDALGVLSIDVSDPTNPVLAATSTPSGAPQEGVHTLFVDELGGALAMFMVTGNSNSFGAYDITNPGSPERMISLDPGGDSAMHDLYVENGLVYINATTQGLWIVDPLAENPYLGVFDSQDYSHSNWVTTAGGRRVSVHGGEGFDAHVQIVDVDPESSTYLQRIGEWQTRPEVSVHNIMAFGERAYLAHYEDGVRVLDISDPTTPTQIAHYNTFDFARSDGSYLQGTAGIDLDLERNLLFASDSQGGLMIFRITVDP